LTMLEKNKRKFFFGVIAGFVISIFVITAITFFISPTALAQVTIKSGLGATFGLGTADLETTIIRVVQWVLGFLGLVAVIFIIYGGVVWMTAGGNADKVTKAKKIITRAVIGLIIVLLSWAIVTYIINRMSQFTGGGGVACTDGDTRGQCELCVGGVWQWQWLWDDCNIQPREFVMNEVETSHDGFDSWNDVHLCSSIKPRFNHRVDDDSVQVAAAADTLEVVNMFDPLNPVPVDGTWITRSKATTFKHPDLLDGGIDYQLWMPYTIADTGGMLLEDCTADPGCTANTTDSRYEWDFHTGWTVDDVPPEIISAYPVLRPHADYPDRNVDRVPIIRVNFSESIDDTSIIGPHDRPTVGTCPDGITYCDEDNACAVGDCEEHFKLEQIDDENGGIVFGGPLDTDNDGVIDYDFLLADSVSNGFEVYLENPFLNPLESFVWYRITVDSIEDLCANPMAVGVDWEFQTNDNVPGIRTWYPRGDRECPDATIGIVFRTSMYNHGVRFQVGDGVNITIPPAADPMFMGFDYAPGPYQIADGNGNRLRIVDPDNAEPSRGFKHFELIPVDPLPVNSNFDVSVTTNMIIDQDNNTLGKDWSFQTATPETCSCLPTITSVNPDAGMIGECITIRGRCLKGVIGSDPLNPVNPAVPDIDFEFPAGTHTPANVDGEDDYGRWLVTTVPDIYSNGDLPDIFVEIDYVDDNYDPVPCCARSNGHPFWVNSDDEATGPCLFSLSRDWGYPNVTEVTLRGIRFNEASGTQEVHFELANDKISTASYWTDTRATATVPNVAVQADYGWNDIWLVNDFGQSNELDFQIRPIPPDLPVVIDWWQTCSTACVNTAIGATFNMDMDDPTVTNNTTLNVCNDLVGDPNCLTDYTDIGATINWWDSTTIGIDPPALLDPDTRYRIVIGGAAQSAPAEGGAPLANTNFDDVTGGLGDSFSWIFATKDDPSECAIDHINVVPETARLAINNSRIYTGRAYASPDDCQPGGQQLDPSAYNWTWSVAMNLAQITPTANDWVVDVLAQTAGDEEVWAAVPHPDPPPPLIQDWGDLTIVDCETDEHCRNNCPGSESVCDSNTGRCTPWISDIDPQTGPAGQFISISGCYFGWETGQVDIGGSNGTFDCANPWSNNLIVTTVPDLASGNDYLVDVLTDDGHCVGGPNDGGLCDYNDAINECVSGSCQRYSTVTDSGQTAMPPNPPPTYEFHVIDTCSGYCADDYSYCEVAGDCAPNFCLFTTLDPNQGVPGICPPLRPSSGKADDGLGNGTKITINGFNLYHEDFDITNDFVRYEPGLLDSITDIISPPRSGSWDAFQIDQTMPPVNSETGLVKVFANNCPSNPIEFGISCSSHSDCDTLCCKNRICQPFEECSSGGIGDPCQIPEVDNAPLPEQSPENPNCIDGPLDPPDGGYHCISDTGDRSDNAPTPPLFSIDPTPYGGDCRFCCIPGEVNVAGLICTADQGDCVGTDPDDRGLYCGCEYDDQCSNSIIEGCSPRGQRCCYARPIVDAGSPDMEPVDGDTGVCRNQAIVIPFDRLMNHASLNSDNIKLYYGIGNNPDCPEGEEEEMVEQPLVRKQQEGKFNILAWLKGLFIKEAKAVPPAPGMDNWCRVRTRIINWDFAGHTETTLIPIDNMPANSWIRLVILGQTVPSSEAIPEPPHPGVLSVERIGLRPDTLNFDFNTTDAYDPDSYMVEFQTGDIICRVDRIELEVQKMEEGAPLTYQPPDLFMCAGDQCLDDMEPPPPGPDNPGNQHYLTATAVDKDGQEIDVGLVYTWEEIDDDGLIDVNIGTDPDKDRVINPDLASPDNGIAYLKVTADAGGMGEVSNTAKIRVNICENPWPNPFAPDYYDFPYEDTDTNFAISYCRDRQGDLLPTFVPPDNVIIPAVPAPIIPGRDELVKEFLFLFEPGHSPSAEAEDVIGMRVYENENNLSPLAWYNEQFPGAPAPQSIIIDGYQAVRYGRSVYVAAANITDCTDILDLPVDCSDPGAAVGARYHNIYLISYNEGALPDTIEVYNRMLDSWEFNINLLGDSKPALQRDFKRVTDLQDVYAKLLQYKDLHGTFPRLEGGTFIQGMTLSKWPSWQDTLGQLAGGNLPIDPKNDFDPLFDDGSGLCNSNDYNQNTCWKDTDPRRYQCPADSHVYQYMVIGDGNESALYAQMEYIGPGNLIQLAVGDPCNPDPAEAECDCFNYMFNATGTVNDHYGPAFVSVDALVEGVCQVIWGVVDLPVDVADLPLAPDPNSGVNRVEFFVDGIRQFTDDDSSDGWGWSLDTNNYQDDSTHTLLVRAYDNVGNWTDISFCITIDHDLSADTTPPSVVILSPDDLATVAGNVLISAQASDNNLLSRTRINVYDGSGNLVDFLQTCGAGPCDGDFSMVWDATDDPNGLYRIHAFAHDPSGNMGSAEIWVTLNNTDIGPPYNVAIVIPVDADGDNEADNPVNNTVTVTVDAEDDVGVDHVSFFIDNNLVGTDDTGPGPWIWNWDTNQYTDSIRRDPPGPYNLVAVAYDAVGQFTSDTMAVEVLNGVNDTIPPEISIDSPASYTRFNEGETFTVTVSASDVDNDDIPRAVARVNFYQDYVNRYSDTGSPWTWGPINADDWTTGCHTVLADAEDLAGNVSEPVRIYIGIRADCIPTGGPVISSWTFDPPNRSVILGETLTVQARVVDTDGVNSVELRIKDGLANPPFYTDIMFETAPGSHIYEGSWVADTPGAFYVDLWAEDTLGNITFEENI